VEDPNMPPRQECYEIGQTCLCIYTTNLAKDIEMLKSKGMEVAYPVCLNSTENLATYKSPDGFVVYIIEFKGFLGLMCRWTKYWNQIGDPGTFHWTINVKDSAKVNKMFEDIGFKSMSDQNKDEVKDDLLPGFGLTGENTVIEHIRLASLPDDQLFLTTMEWVQPESTKNGQELLNRVSISVDNVETTMQKAKDAGMIVEEGAIQTISLPYYGQVSIGTAYLEEGSNPIEFVAF